MGPVVAAQDRAAAVKRRRNPAPRPASRKYESQKASRATRKKIMLVVGTRPECIKMAPLIRELRRQDFAELRLVGTGQHKDLTQQALDVFDLTLDADLGVSSPDQPLGRLIGRLFQRLDEYLAGENPDLVLVQGDTASAMAASVAAFYRRIPVGHVEAGLRTSKLTHPFPEEMHRRVSGMVASLHFAPTATARQNLIAEGVAPSTIWVTGNTIVDAVKSLARTAPPCAVPVRAGSRIILVTVHRRDNYGAALAGICEAIFALRDRFDDVEFILPLHLNPNISRAMRRLLAGGDRIHLLPPAGYREFIGLMKASHLILTDSGGVQEEAPPLGKPVFVLRSETERPEAVAAGMARVVGTAAPRIIDAVAAVLKSPERYSKMVKRISPFGDGRASGRIAAICRKFLGAKAFNRSGRRASAPPTAAQPKGRGARASARAGTSRPHSGDSADF
jgi:UDP-N-acetylglucosamine 2-epimerase (non-hydrolysing)